MANLELKYKAQVVDRILGCHAEFRESFGFHCYRLEDLQYGYPVEKVSFESTLCEICIISQE